MSNETLKLIGKFTIFSVKCAKRLESVNAFHFKFQAHHIDKRRGNKIFNIDIF